MDDESAIQIAAEQSLCQHEWTFCGQTRVGCVYCRHCGLVRPLTVMFEEMSRMYHEVMQAMRSIDRARG